MPPLGVTPHLGCRQVLGHLSQQPVHHSARRAAVTFPQDVLQLAVRLHSVTLGTEISPVLLCPSSRGAARHASVLPGPGTHGTVALGQGKDWWLDVPSSPPGLAGAAAAKSRHRQGQGLPPCLSPCDVYLWARSPHRQRDLEGKSRAAATGVAWSQGRASGQLREEPSPSHSVGWAVPAHVWSARRGERAFPLLGYWGNHGGWLHSAEQGLC